MSESEIAYWASMTQLLPLLGLGIIVEARAIATSRFASTTPKLRFIQSVLFAASGLCCAFGIYVSLTALRSNAAPSMTREGIVSWSALIAVAVIIINPLLSASARTNAHTLAVVLSTAPLTIWRRYRAIKAGRRLQRAVTDGRDLAYRHLVSSEQYIADAQRAIQAFDRMPRPWPEQLAGIHDTVEDLLGKHRESEAEARNRLRRLIMRELNTEIWVRSTVSQGDEIMKSRRTKAVADYEMYIKSGQRPTVDPLGEEPEDGGFLRPSPGLRILRIDDVPEDRFIRDPSEFDRYGR